MGARTGIMLASPYSQRKLEKWITPDLPFVFGQRKLNGERLIWRNGRLLSSEGNLVTGIHHIVAALTEHFSSWHLDGEAYCHGMSRQIIHSIVSRELSKHPRMEEIKFHIFDTPTSDAQFKRLAWLMKNKEKIEAASPNLLVEETFRITSHAMAFDAVNQFVNDGYEGLIIRHPLGVYAPLSRAVMMKWKPKEEDVYEIVEALESDPAGKYKGSLGSFIVRDKEGRIFHVGSLKVTDRERARLWSIRNRLPGEKCKVRYVELTDAGIPPSSVYICLVSEEEDDDPR